MRPDIYQSDPKMFTNTGRVKIDMRCDVDTDVVTIHIKQLNITTFQLTKQGW